MFYVYKAETDPEYVGFERPSVVMLIYIRHFSHFLFQWCTFANGLMETDGGW